jgi:hypothetical protein
MKNSSLLVSSSLKYYGGVGLVSSQSCLLALLLALPTTKAGKKDNVLKLEISYYRVLIYILKDFGFFLEDFLKIR